MAGETLEKIRQIIDDLTASWYFRIWAVTWLILALTTFSGMIILSKTSNQAQKQNDVVFWVENVTSIQFPRFHLRLDHRSSVIFHDSPQCVLGGQVLTAGPCQMWMGFQPAMNQCVAFNSNSFTAQNSFGGWETNRILCEAVTYGEGNDMISFELEGINVFGIAAMAYEPTWFAPNDQIAVMLGKSIWHSSSGWVELWNKNLFYHSTMSVPNFYNLSVILQDFWVRVYEPRDTYNGWMAVGSIGGVGFFMTCLHTLVMIIVGLFMANNSTFLNGEHKH